MRCGRPRQRTPRSRAAAPARRPPVDGREVAARRVRGLPPRARRARGSSGRRRPSPARTRRSRSAAPSGGSSGARGRRRDAARRPARAAPAGTCPASSADRRRRRRRAARAAAHQQTSAATARGDPHQAGVRRRGPGLLLEPLDHLHLVGVVVEHVRLEDAGRAGDVDLGQPAADHVQADEEVTALAQARPQHADDLGVALVQLGRHRLGADVQVAARVVGRRHAQHRAQELAVARAGCACRPGAPRAGTSAPSSSGGRGWSPARGSRRCWDRPCGRGTRRSRPTRPAA